MMYEIINYDCIYCRWQDLADRGKFSVERAGCDVAQNTVKIGLNYSKFNVFRH